MNDEKIIQHEIWTMVDMTVMQNENVLFSISMEHFKARRRPSVYDVYCIRVLHKLTTYMTGYMRRTLLLQNLLSQEQGKSPMNISILDKSEVPLFYFKEHRTQKKLGLRKNSGGIQRYLTKQKDNTIQQCIPNKCLENKWSTKKILINTEKSKCTLSPMRLQCSSPKTQNNIWAGASQ